MLPPRAISPFVTIAIMPFSPCFYHYYAILFRHYAAIMLPLSLCHISLFLYIIYASRLHAISPTPPSDYACRLLILIPNAECRFILIFAFVT